MVTYYAFYSENQAAADDAANGEEAAGQLPLSLALAVSRASWLPLLRCFAAVAATS